MVSRTHSNACTEMHVSLLEPEEWLSFLTAMFYHSLFRQLPITLQEGKKVVTKAGHFPHLQNPRRSIGLWGECPRR